MSVETTNSTKLSDGTIFGIGNPLLDIVAEVPLSFLESYNLKANDAILATDEHKGLYETLIRDFPNHEFVAGGSTQNTMRAATWLLEQANSCIYMGCVGQDKFHQLLHDAATQAGLMVSYQVRNFSEDRQQTGTCAVLINGHHRSLVANLGAANFFTVEHFDDPKNQNLIDQAKIFYTAGFFYSVCHAAVMYLCSHVFQHEKIFCTNLSASFICEHHGEKLIEAMPYVDYLFGNETEARCFAKHQLKLESDDVKTIAQTICELPKRNKARQRVVIITQGCEPTILAIAGQEIQEFNVKKPLRIVDTNGAGDSFVGGFLAYLALGKTNEECIQAGAYCALECIQQSGCKFPERPNFDLTKFVA